MAYVHTLNAVADGKAGKADLSIRAAAVETLMASIDRGLESVGRDDPAMRLQGSRIAHLMAQSGITAPTGSKYIAHNLDTAFRAAKTRLEDRLTIKSFLASANLLQ